MISRAKSCKVNGYGYERNYRHKKTSSLRIRDAKKELIIGKKIHILTPYKYDRNRFRKKHYHVVLVEPKSLCAIFWERGNYSTQVSMGNWISTKALMKPPISRACLSRKKAMK